MKRCQQILHSDIQYPKKKCMFSYYWTSKFFNVFEENFIYKRHCNLTFEDRFIPWRWMQTPSMIETNLSRRMCDLLRKTWPFVRVLAIFRAENSSFPSYDTWEGNQMSFSGDKKLSIGAQCDMVSEWMALLLQPSQSLSRTTTCKNLPSSLQTPPAVLHRLLLTSCRHSSSNKLLLVWYPPRRACGTLRNSTGKICSDGELTLKYGQQLLRKEPTAAVITKISCNAKARAIFPNETRAFPESR
jgi:hypothetical protein